MLFELRIRILANSNASNPFSVHQKIEKPKMLRMKFWTSDPVTLIIGFALIYYAQKWSQIVKMLDRCPQNVDFGIFVRSLRTQL